MHVTLLLLLLLIDQFSSLECPCVLIVSPIQEPRKGLEEDVDIYLHAFHPMAVRYSDVEYLNLTRNSLCTLPRAVIHLENVYKPYRTSNDATTKHYLMLNPEIPLPDANVYYHIDVVIVKTRAAEIVAKQVIRAIRRRDRANERRRHRRLPAVEYWSHTSLDRRQSNFIRGRDNSSFLFIGGASVMKHVDAVVDAWKANADFWPLTLLRFGPFVDALMRSLAPLPPPRNLRVITRYTSEAEVWRLMNAHALHICSSYSEGFGHTLNGARSVGALTIVPDQPPFNELVDADSAVLMSDRDISVRLPVYWYDQKQIANITLPVADVRRRHIERAVRRVMQLPTTARAARGSRARRRYEQDSAEFYLRTRKWLVEMCKCMNETLL